MDLSRTRWAVDPFTGRTMLNLSRLDLDEIAHVLADQTDYEHR